MFPSDSFLFVSIEIAGYPVRKNALTRLLMCLNIEPLGRC